MTQQPKNLHIIVETIAELTDILDSNSQVIVQRTYNGVHAILTNTPTEKKIEILNVEMNDKYPRIISELEEYKDNFTLLGVVTDNNSNYYKNHYDKR